MPRLPRIILDDAIFHIFNRGNSRRIIFHNDEDFRHFVYILAYYKDQYRFKLYHHCLMPNHFHFELWVEDGKTLPLAMHDITQTYTKYYHQKYGTVGYLWQGRYKSMVVEKRDYHWKLGGYIERNPVKAGLVKKPDDWKYSSYGFYAFSEPTRVKIKKEGNEKLVDLVDEDIFYPQFGTTSSERQRGYRDFILNMDDNTVKKYLGLEDRKLVVGSESFKKEMHETLGRIGIKISTRPRGRPRKG